MAKGGKDVVQLALYGSRIADAIGGEQRQMKGLGKFQGRLVARFLIAMEVALQLDINILATKNSDQRIHGAACRFYAANGERCGQRSFLTTREANEPRGVFL